MKPHRLYLNIPFIIFSAIFLPVLALLVLIDVVGAWVVRGRRVVGWWEGE